VQGTGKRKQPIPPVYAILAIILLIAVAILYARRERYGLSEGDPMPRFILEDHQARRFDSSALWGKVVVIAFWKVSAEASAAEIKGLDDLRKTYGDRGFEAVGISLDEEEKYVKAFVARHQVRIPLLIGSRETAHLFGGIKGVPTIYIFDREGRVKEVLEGFRGKQAIEEKILELL